MTAPIASPCPFCSHDDVEIDEIGPKVYAVTCPECECIGPASRCTPEDAITRWNMRWSGLVNRQRATPLTNLEY